MQNADPGTVDIQDYKSFENRMKTFDKWPLKFLSPEQLANNGFYYLGRGDEVRCAFCKVEIMRWEEGDDPAIDHKRWAPQCPFLQKQTITLNSSRELLQELQQAGKALLDADFIFKGQSDKNCVTDGLAADLRRFEERMKTFVNWPVAFLPPEQLASNGFYYLGRGDEVRCAFCKVEIMRWVEGDDPANQHKRWVPQCPFLRMLTTTVNNPGQGDRNCVTDGSAADLSRFEERLKTFVNWSVAFMSPEQLASNGFYYLGRSDEVRCAYCKVKFFNWEQGDDPADEHKRWSPQCPFLPNGEYQTRNNVYVLSTGNLSTSQADLRRLEERLKTFDNWPLTYLSPERLAGNGFYYVGVGDEVRCAFCNVEIARWNEGDDPAEEHERWSLKCPFLWRAMNTGNRGRDGNEEPPPPSIETGSILKPCHPCYLSEAERLHTYNDWPRCIRQKPEVLAEAGFFYTGQGDKTKCFYCDGGIKDWEEGDEPWAVHAQWYSYCPYVQLVKGNDYIQSVLAKCSSTEASEQSRPEENADSGERLKSPGELQEATIVDETKLCRLCFADERNVAIVPCGHVVACAKCALSLTKCPVCRKRFQSLLRLYYS